MDKEKLTPEEIETLTKLLQKVTPLPKMEWPVLKTIWESRLMPMNPMELVILEKDPLVCKKGEYPRVLLAYRDDKDFPNCWHHPGGYLGSGEFTFEAVDRVALKETIVRVTNLRCASPVNWPRLRRDHELSILYVCQPHDNPKIQKGKLEWFDFLNLPQYTLPHHIRMHLRAKLYIDVLRKQTPESLREFLELHTVLESDLEV